MIRVVRALSTPKLLVGVFLLAALLIYAYFFLRYSFFGGGMWTTVEYALKGGLVISYFSLTAVLIFTSFAAVGRVSRRGALRFIAPVIAVLLVLNSILLTLGSLSSSGTLLVFLIVFGVLGFFVGSSQALAAIVNRQLIDAGFLVAAFLACSKALEYVLLGHYAMDWRLLSCAACYALPVAVVIRLSSSQTIVADLALGAVLMILLCTLLSEPYLPLRPLGVVILPYIKAHAVWSYWTWSLAAISAGIAVLNALHGYGSHWKLPQTKGRSLYAFAIVGAYSLVILLESKYENEAGVRELLIIASTIWMTTCFFGPRLEGESEEKHGTI